LGNAELELQLLAELVDGLGLEDLQRVPAGVRYLVPLSR
jgi:hypothetical protein